MWKLCCVQMDAIREILATIFEMVFEERNSTTIFRKNEYVRKDIKMKVKDLKDLIKDAGLDDNTEITIMGKTWKLLSVGHYGVQYTNQDGKCVRKIHIGI